MYYQEQLEQAKWKDRRHQILERDSFTCTNCKIKRSDFLGLNYKFGIMTYYEFVGLGYNVVIDSENNLIEIMRDGNKVSFLDLIEDPGKLELDQLSFAKKFKKSNSIFVFPSFELICFQTNTLDMNKYFDLNIHHKYYVKGRKAWEYDDDALITLCVDCHKLEHESNSIPIFDKNNNILSSTEICDRCNGKGILPEFKYNKNGVCFKCNGLGDLFDFEICFY